MRPALTHTEEQTLAHPAPHAPHRRSNATRRVVWDGVAARAPETQPIQITERARHAAAAAPPLPAPPPTPDERLWRAAHEGREDDVRSLLAGGARDPDLLGELGSPPLFAAAAAERLVDKA